MLNGQLVTTEGCVSLVQELGDIEDYVGIFTWNTVYPCWVLISVNVWIVGIGVFDNPAFNSICAPLVVWISSHCSITTRTLRWIRQIKGQLLLNNTRTNEVLHIFVVVTNRDVTAVVVVPLCGDIKVVRDDRLQTRVTTAAAATWRARGHRLRANLTSNSQSTQLVPQRTTQTAAVGSAHNYVISHINCYVQRGQEVVVAAFALKHRADFIIVGCNQIHFVCRHPGDFTGILQLKRCRIGTYGSIVVTDTCSRTNRADVQVQLNPCAVRLFFYHTQIVRLGGHTVVGTSVSALGEAAAIVEVLRCVINDRMAISNAKLAQRAGVAGAADTIEVAGNTVQ